MPEMNADELRWAIKVLDGFADSFLPIMTDKEEWAYNEAHFAAERFRAQLAALPPQKEDGQYKLMVWTDHCTFAAVAHAKTVEQARALVEAEDLGGTDESCPERQAAREMIYGQTPGIYRRGNAVLMFDTGNREALPPQPDLRAALVEAREALMWQLGAIDEGFYTYPNGSTSCSECSASSPGRQDTIAHTEECASGHARAAIARIDAVLEVKP